MHHFSLFLIATQNPIENPFSQQHKLMSINYHLKLIKDRAQAEFFTGSNANACQISALNKLKFYNKNNLNAVPIWILSKNILNLIKFSKIHKFH